MWNCETPDAAFALNTLIAGAAHISDNLVKWLLAPLVPKSTQVNAQARAASVEATPKVELKRDTRKTCAVNT